MVTAATIPRKMAGKNDIYFLHHMSCLKKIKSKSLLIEKWPSYVVDLPVKDGDFPVRYVKLLEDTFSDGRIPSEEKKSRSILKPSLAPHDCLIFGTLVFYKIIASHKLIDYQAKSDRCLIRIVNESYGQRQ